MFAARNLMLTPVSSVVPSSVAYNATGAGWILMNNPSYSITVAANSYVVVFIATSSPNAPSSATCGGVAMTQLATVGYNGSSANGSISAYGLAVSASGSKAIAISGTSWLFTYQVSNAVSYTGVTAVKAFPTTASGSGLPSVSETLSAGQMITAAIGRTTSFGGATITPSGGTSRYTGNTAGAVNASMSIADSASNLTLSSTGTGTNWGGIALVLT